MPHLRIKKLKLTLIKLILLVLLIQSNPLKAQDGYDIVATVTDEKDSLLFGNILLLSPLDSTLIRGAYFMEGKASLSGVKNVVALVKFTSLGYQDVLLEVNNRENKTKIDLGSIKLSQSSMTLDEMTVVGNVPLFETGSNGIVKVNVQKTMLASSTSVTEVLSKSPNILVGDKGATVVGKGEALLYLDGKQIPFERLSSIPVNTIDKIEVITNPSGKYDAEGRAVINILTIPNYSEGIQGSVAQNFTMAKYFMSSTVLGLNYRKGKWSVSGGYGADFGTDWALYKSSRFLQTSERSVLSEVEADQNFDQNFVSNYRAGLGYQINSRSDFTVEYAGTYYTMDLLVESNNIVKSNGATTTLLKALTEGDHFFYTNSLTLNYNNKLDSLGSSLFVGGQFFNFEGGLDDLIREDKYASEALITSAVRNNQGRHSSSVATTQIDYAKHFKNGSRLEIGSKYGLIRYNGKVDFFTKSEENEKFIAVPEYANNFDYEENIQALYLQYQGNSIGNLNYALGLRSEYTLAKGVSKITEKVIVDSTYLNFFPNFSVNGKLTKSLELNFSYAARIDRPQYEDLDPFLVYLDSITTYRGNPYLKPEITHAFEQTIGYRNYNLTLGFNHSLNPRRYVVLVGNAGEGSFELTQINYQKLNSFFTSLSVPLEFKFWSSNNTASFIIDKLIDNKPQFTFGKTRPQLYFYSFNKFNVKNQFNIELNGEYVGANSNGLYSVEPTGSVSAGLSKSFLNNTLTCRLLANDIFHTNRRVISYTIDNTQIKTDITPNTHLYRLSVTYSFGKLKNVAYRSKAPGMEEFNRAR